MTRRTIVVVGGDPAVCDSIRKLVESAGLQVEIFPSLRAFLSAAGSELGGCLVLADSGDLDSPERRVEFSECCARLAVILIAERGDVEAAVRALKAGAADVVPKSDSDHRLLGSIKKALDANSPAGH